MPTNAIFGTYCNIMLVLDSVTKRFGSKVAVNQLSLEIKTGQVLGLLGPNGAGKTTTMRLIVGYLNPDSGSITLNGVSVVDHPEQVRQHIGYLPENNPLYSELLVSEMLASSAQLKQMNSAKLARSLDFVVPAVGLEEVYRQPIRELSKGYKQRVGIALALLHEPEVLILDEPTEGLDPNQRTEIRALLRRLAKDKTVIISTHVMQEVSAICDRIVIISHGSIVADGTEKTLLQRNNTGTIRAEIEGKNALSIIKKEPRVAVITHKTVGKRLFIEIESKTKVPAQVVLSEIQQKHQFVLWSLSSVGADLEHLFKTVTEEKS